MKILLANPRGFCAGVNMAIQTVEEALKIVGTPLYVYHEIVHNRHVVDQFIKEGVVFIDTIDEAPAKSTVIFSAHGVSPAVRNAAKSRGCTLIDATCPLVTKVHMEVSRYSRDGSECVLIGHKGHPEVEGTMGQYDDSNGGHIYLVEDEQDAAALEVNNPDRLSYVTQTTLSMDDTSRVIDALRLRFPNIEGPRKDDICYATQNRQDAVKTLASDSDLLLVVGSPNSSNSNRLRELGERMGAKAHLIDSAAEIQPEWLNGVKTVGITAGASAPEVLVREVVDALVAMGGEAPQELAGIPENVVFSLPKELRLQEVD